MNFYYVFLTNGTSEICTRNAIDEMPSVAEFVRDSREAKIIDEEELPIVIYRNRVLSHKRVRIILRETWPS